MKTEIMNKASRLFHTTGLKAKKYSPEILLVAGIAGAVTSTVMACKATIKATEVMEETKENLEIIHEADEKGVTIAGESYSKEDTARDTYVLYVQTGVKLLKLYGPAIAVGTLSIAAMVSGHKILKKRNLALAAAYTAVDKGFKNYRKNVVERFGEELDKELRYNIKAKEVENVVKNEDGTETIEKKMVNEYDMDQLEDISEFSKFFDEGCADFTKDPELNLLYLRKQQEWANEKLKANGHLFLNEVYDMLGLPRTKAGQIVGWIYDKNNAVGDNYVDFGIYRGTERSMAFVNGYEPRILLDFNVDGNIYDLI